MACRTTLAWLALFLSLCGEASAHGGSYRGPGDVTPTMPPRPGDALGGRSGSVSRDTPGPGARPPSSTAPDDPSSAGLRSMWLFSSGPSARPDPARWQAWWGFNRDAFLGLKARLHSADVLLGSEDSFLGRQAFALDELRPAAPDVFGTVAPTLLELLERETSSEIVSGTLIALAKIGDAPGKRELAARITPFLGDPDQEVAETAAVALGLLGSPSEVELLRAVLGGRLSDLSRLGLELRHPPSERTRAFAAYGLGLVGRRSEGAVRERIAGVLGGWMQRERALAAQDEVPVACVVALGLVPLPRDPFVVAPPAFPAFPERICSFEEQVQWMLALLERRAESPRVRAHVPTALARLLGTEQGRRCVLRGRALDSLAARLDASFDEHAEVRVGCILALGQLATAGPEDAALRERLMRVREHFPDLASASLALISLGRASGRPGSGLEPFAALGSGPRCSRPWLLERLSAASSAERCYAALALGLLERSADEAGQAASERTLGALRRALELASSPDEVGALAIALGIARDRAAGELLHRRLASESDSEARGHLAVALGLVGAQGSMARLRELVAASRFQPELLRQAALALGLLGDKQVVPQLCEMLTRATSQSSQVAIVSALGLIGDARSLDRLAAMARDRERCTDHARAFAAVALGMSADRDPLPWNSQLAADANYRANTPTLHAPESGTGILDIL